MAERETVDRATLFEFVREMGIKLDANTRVLRNVEAVLRGLQRDMERAKKKRHGFKRKMNVVGMNMKIGSSKWKKHSAWHSWGLTFSKTKRTPED